MPGEHALTIYLNRREIVTLMTIGGAPEALVVGYLRNQRLVESVDDIESVHVDWESGAAAVRTRRRVQNVAQRTARRVVTTGCGQGTVFASVMEEFKHLSLDPSARITQRALYSVVETIRATQSIYKQAGSVHGCALFQLGPEVARLMMFFEDVGRHNAIDAIAGRMWLDAVDGGDKVFYTTGRLTSEMVIKAAQMGIPIVMSRSGVTQMGYDLASQVGMMLLGRCSGRHFLVYTGKERLLPDATLADAVPGRREANLSSMAEA